MRLSLSFLATRLLVAMLAMAIALSAAGSLGLWSLVATPTAAHDDANLFLWAVDLEAWLARGGAGTVPPNVRGAPYPPLLPLAAARVFQAVGARSPALAEATGAATLLPLCLSAAWMGWATHPPKRRALAALAAAALAPLPLWSLGHPGSFHLDLPLGALVGASVCCGLVAVCRGGAAAPVAAGLLAALALSVKWTAAAFLVPAWVVGLFRNPRAAALAAGVCGLLAAPWYATALPDLLAFAQANLAGDFDGGANPLALSASFYPSRLCHGVLGTPLLGCCLLGAIQRGPHQVALGALLVGMLLLTLQPYPDERYLLGGLALLVPAVVQGAVRVAGRGGLLVLFASGLFFVWSWLPLPLPEGTLIDDRNGLRPAGLRAARADLVQPALRWKGRALDPLRPADPLRLASRALHRSAPRGPLALHIVDLVGRSVLERTRVEMAALRGPGVQLSRPAAREATLRAALRQGEQKGWAPPVALRDRAWVLVNLRVEDLAVARPVFQALAAEGRRVAYRGGASEGERPGVVVLWTPPEAQHPG